MKGNPESDNSPVAHTSKQIVKTKTKSDCKLGLSYRSCQWGSCVREDF